MLEGVRLLVCRSQFATGSHGTPLLAALCSNNADGDMSPYDNRRSLLAAMQHVGNDHSSCYTRKGRKFSRLIESGLRLPIISRTQDALNAPIARKTERNKSSAADRAALLLRVLGQEARFSGGLTGVSI
jgi:hypothetical protein